VAFQLSKWYLDCVTETGDAAVLYWASLRWGLLRLNYGAALVSRGGDRPEQRYTLRPEHPPECGADGTIGWRCDRLDVAAQWKGRADGIERTLLDGPQGRIRWNCMLPMADASVQVGKHTLRGLGYAEYLTMTVKPWQLPIEELRWGRFISHSDSLVWISWRGSLPRTWVFANGAELTDARIGSFGLESSNEEFGLSIDDGQVLRSGRLASTALRPISWIASVMPRWRAACETKWVARALVTSPSGSNRGWVVHEVVQCP
jgi:hypothetical protein